MARHVFMTGFPGFIGSQLIDRLARREADIRFTLLIQEKMREAANAALAKLDAVHRGLAGRTTLLAGDISRPQLGLSDADYQKLAGSITNVWHLAAIYDLAVPEAIAYRVNVVGTSNVLDLCQDAKNLERLDYVSTCYVAGKRGGVVKEDDLDEGQGFKNHYESTKCWAEMEVRRRMKRVPTCVHRPGIVVGDSKTGQTDKYDGPYFVITLFMRLPGWLPMVNIGDGKARVNIVPVDFVVDAMAALMFNPKSIGQTVALADPNPHTAKEIVERLLEVLGRGKPVASLPSGMVERALESGKVRQLVKVPREAVIYFNHDVEFDTANQRRLLEGSGVRCPDLLDILPTLVEYVKANPDKAFLDGRRF